MTEEYGLYIARKNSKEQNLNRLRPQQMKKAQLKTAVLDARQASNNWESFIAELSKRHIGMQTTSNKLTDKVVGLSFSLDETHSAGSRIVKVGVTKMRIRTSGNFNSKQSVRLYFVS